MWSLIVLRVNIRLDWHTNIKSRIPCGKTYRRFKDIIGDVLALYARDPDTLKLPHGRTFGDITMPILGSETTEMTRVMPSESYRLASHNEGEDGKGAKWFDFATAATLSSDIIPWSRITYLISKLAM